MDIVLLGLSPPRLQHLAAAIGPALTQFAPNWTLYTPLDTPLSHPAWTPTSLSSRILLCTSPEDAPNAQAWRANLLAQGLPFQVIHGIGQELVKQCLLAILPPDCFNPSGLARQELPVRWQGVCETCSDPDCEQRLFSGLLQGR
jgi:hypothetical protein